MASLPPGESNPKESKKRWAVAFRLLPHGEARAKRYEQTPFVFSLTGNRTAQRAKRYEETPFVGGLPQGESDEYEALLSSLTGTRQEAKRCDQTWDLADCLSLPHGERAKRYEQTPFVFSLTGNRTAQRAKRCEQTPAKRIVGANDTKSFSPHEGKFVGGLPHGESNPTDSKKI